MSSMGSYRSQELMGEKGFTLIELLFVFMVIGVLTGLSIVGLHVYRADATYSVVESTMGFAKTALEGGILATEEGPASVALYTQTTPGEIADPSVRDLLPTLLLPDNVKFQVQYTSGCTGDPTCLEAIMQIDPCKSSNEFVRWMKWGDGVTVQFDHVAGASCS